MPFASISKFIHLGWEELETNFIASPYPEFSNSCVHIVGLVVSMLDLPLPPLNNEALLRSILMVDNRINYFKLPMQNYILITVLYTCFMIHAGGFINLNI